MNRIVCVLCLVLLFACKHDNKEEGTKVDLKSKTIEVKSKPVYIYGFNLDNYNEVNDTIRSGDTFGKIMNDHNVPFSRINEISTSARDTFDIRGMRVNKPYTILTTKDSLQEAKVFIYKKNKISTKIIDFTDSIPKVYTHNLPIKVIERQVSGVVLNNFSKAMDTLGIRTPLTYKISEIYAATIDFFRLQKGDTFKIIFDEKFIKDSISVGYGEVKCMVFKHNNEDLYAYHYVTDSIKKLNGFFDEEGRMLQRQFLKSPIKFQFRISSRFNLRRRIALYGNKIRPHKGTDFPAPQGTPIMATANGTVIESTRRGGNGNFVKIRHDQTYSTQYLHMKKRKVKVGNYVKQGDVIGWVGMTGNTSGPHVCYRFWKNGVQVDPFRQKMPAATPMPKKLISGYLDFIKPLRLRLDSIK